MQYGRFSNSGREYVIARPDTPRPWINYIMGRRLKMFISQAAGGCLWYREPNCGRLTRYRFNGLPIDSPGFYLYIKDGDSVWNPSYFPVMTELDRYECRHGLGYTRFVSEKNRIQVSVTYFIPLEDDILIWDVSVTNTSNTSRTIILYPYMEFSLHDFDKDTYAFLVCGNQARYTFDREANGIVTDYFAFEADFMGKSLFAASEPVHAYDMDRDEFIGKGRTEANPIGLSQGLRNSKIPDGGRYACGVMETAVTLPPGATRSLNFRYSVSESLDESRRLSARYADTETVNTARQKVREYWHRALCTAQVETPDPAVNALINTWLPNNIRVTLKNARSISTRHTGSGAALRFRDSMQDAMPATQLFTDEARTMILTALRTMLSSGRTVCQVNPETLRAPETKHTRIDAALWGVFTVYRYLAETGNMKFLDEVIPYYDDGEGAVLEHLLRGMRFIGTHVGIHGLPRLFDVDWNDMLKVFSSSRPDGESIMVAEQFIYAAGLMGEILTRVGGMEEEATWLRERRDAFASVLNSDICWDGAWFKRLVFEDGTVMGSRQNRQARIFLNTQTWAAIAGILDRDKVRKALDAVDEKLSTPFGIRIFAPPLTSMPDGAPFYSNTPGAGENGGLFLHANTWAIMAEAMQGNGDRAWQYFSRILPTTLSGNAPDRYENEPYAFTSWVYGPDHERYGAGQLSWLTGGAAWLYTVGMEYILGIRPTLNGMLIEPCIPPAWSDYTVCRRWQGTEYTITVKNPKHLSSGEVRLKVDDTLVRGNRLPASDKNAVRVEATLCHPAQS